MTDRLIYLSYSIYVQNCFVQSNKSETVSIKLNKLTVKFVNLLALFIISFDADGTVDHPFALRPDGTKVQVTGTPGDTLVVVRLPFGSFSPTQPPATINFTVNMSNLADVGTPLSVQARGGFEFGEITPLNDWCCGDDAERISISSRCSRCIPCGLGIGQCKPTLYFTRA